MKSQKWSESEALGSDYTFKDGLLEYYTVCPNKCIRKLFKVVVNNLETHFTWKFLYINDYFLMYKCRYVKEQHIHLLSWHTNRDGVCYISSIFLYFYWDFDNRDCFHDKRTFIGSFIGSNPSARVCLEVLVTILSLNLETVYIGSFLCYISFCFLYSPVFFSHKVTYLSHAISPYLHGKLITWTSAFYLSFCCRVLPKILNILILMNRVISIICICQLYFLHFHM